MDAAATAATTVDAIVVDVATAVPTTVAATTADVTMATLPWAHPLPLMSH